MIHFLPKILSADECKKLTDIFDSERKTATNRDKHVEKDYIYSSTNSFGFSSSNHLFNVYLHKLTPKIMSFLGESSNVYIEPENTYVREYINDCVLRKHIDRENLNVTMSICLYNDLKIEWPLYAEINGETKGYDTKIGDGILLFDADKNTHWRDKLVCDENERVVQFFLHWKIVENIKNKKTLL